ncbi:uncharacterized protein LOC125469264 [Pyrus x bretschneideri]|uniref:uncharacterized protein LOC125469264 n=1 Tax=Pyrus x bretschneideri TaxID=225117 RepID=UPI0020306DFB|nr:uncharacterized protein LOC125469264 [Pyrus x bretschneideri]
MGRTTVKPAFSTCFSNPPCLLRLADPRHRRSRLRPILLSPPSSYSSFPCLWNPRVIFLTCKAMALSIETKTCLSFFFIFMAVLRKSTKKEEPVLEGLLKQYFDDDLINPQLITMYGATNNFGQGTRDTHLLTLWARAPVGSALLSPPTAGFVPDQFSFTFNNLYNYIALDYYFKLRFLMHFGIFEIVGNFRV